MAMSHVAGRALKDPAINVEEIDPQRGLLRHVAGTGYGDDIPRCLFSIFRIMALCFQNDLKKKKKSLA